MAHPKAGEGANTRRTEVVTSAFRNGNNFLNSIVCKSRHFKTNFFVCVQHPYQCPRALRSQCSHLKKILEEMAKENCSHLTPEEFIQLFQHATQNPHDFMLCDFKTNEVRRNFNEVLKISPQLSAPLTNAPKEEASKAKQGT